MKEWFLEVMVSACELLGLFEKISTEMSSESKITVSKYILMSKVLINKCENFLANDTRPPLVKKMAQIMLTDLKMRFKDIDQSPIIAESTILDPRLKNNGFLDNAKYVLALEKFKNKFIGHLSPENSMNTKKRRRRRRRIYI